MHQNPDHDDRNDENGYLAHLNLMQEFDGLDNRNGPKRH
jgi:hypothetical protein